MALKKAGGLCFLDASSRCENLNSLRRLALLLVLLLALLLALLHMTLLLIQLLLVLLMPLWMFTPMLDKRSFEAYGECHLVGRYPVLGW